MTTDYPNRPNGDAQRVTFEELDRYLADECIGEERQRIEKILAANPDNINLAEALIQSATSGEFDSSKAWSGLEPRIKKEINVRRQVPDRTFLQQWGGYFLAICIIAFAAPYAWKQLSMSSNSVTKREFSTGRAQRATVTLSDGSTVTLAPETKIVVTGRNVSMKGEALFTVSHKTGNPFTVTLNQTVLRVLGTTFVMRGYPEDKTVKVAVGEGRVSVNNTLLSNGDLAFVDNNIVIKHDAERVAEVMSFAQGKLIIDGKTLLESKLQLERWLDVRISVDKSIGNMPFRATLRSGDTREILNEIAILTNSKYVLKGNNVVFRREQSNP